MASVVASASASNTHDPIVCNKPTGTADGHLMVAFQATDWGTYAAMTAPAGWSLLGGYDRGNDNLHIKIWYKVAGPSEAATYSFPQGTSADGTVSIVTLSGAQAKFKLAIDVNATGASQVCPSVGRFSASDVLVCGAMLDGTGSAITWTAPSGMTEQTDVNSNGFTTSSLATLDGPSDPSGAKTLTASAAGAVAGLTFSLAVADSGASAGGINQVADRGHAQDLTSATTTAVDMPEAGSIATGNYLIARLALDNAGTNGAAPTLSVTDPRSNSWTVLGPANVDPGAASAGASLYVAYAKVNNAYTNGDDITFTYNVSVSANAIVVEEWSGIHATNPIAVTSTTTTGTSTTPSISRTPLAAGSVFYGAIAAEGPETDTFTQDSDTTDGVWSTLSCVASTNATATNNQIVHGVWKKVSGTTAQTWNPTLGTSRDWAALAFVLAPAAEQTNASAQTANATGTTYDAVIAGDRTASAQAATASGTANNATVSIGRYVVGVSGRNFVDASGTPILVCADTVWGLPFNAGRWNGGDWQADIDNYINTRSSQGHNALYFAALGSTQNGGVYDNGNTHDNISPWVGGVIGTLNDSYWERLDYLVEAARSKNMTCFFNAIYSEGDTPLAGATVADYGNYGTALGNRYKNYPNIVWQLGGDAFDGIGSRWDAWLSGIRGAGDNHLVSMQNYPESTSRRDGADAVMNWGTNNAQYNAVYSYNVTYFMVERGWQESAIPVLWLDGHYATNTAADDRVMRNLTWWAVTSGALCGVVTGTESIWAWQAAAATAITNEPWASTIQPAIMGYLRNRLYWHLLEPDISSTFILTNRGTHATGLTPGGGGGQYDSSDPTDTWIGAAVASNRTLAVIIIPTSRTFTIDESKMISGYKATWVDPVNVSTSSATAGSSYTTPGNNSAGNPDWVLVLESFAGFPNAAGATGTANDATVSTATGSNTNASAETATATATTHAVEQIKVSPTEDVANATATANPTQAKANAQTANVAATTETVESIKVGTTAEFVPASAIGNTVEQVKISPVPTNASATATAGAATISTETLTQASAQVATASSTANDATRRTDAEPATANGSASPTEQVKASPHVSTASGAITTHDATADSSSTASAAANAADVASSANTVEQIRVNSVQSTVAATGTGHDATVSTATQTFAVAEVAIGNASTTTVSAHVRSNVDGATVSGVGTTPAASLRTGAATTALVTVFGNGSTVAFAKLVDAGVAATSVAALDAGVQTSPSAANVIAAANDAAINAVAATTRGHMSPASRTSQTMSGTQGTGSGMSSIDRGTTTITGGS